MKAIKQTVILCLLLAFTHNVKAYDFSDDDWIYYNVIDENSLTCEVTYDDKESWLYEGEVTIPSTVSHAGKIYTVVAVGNNAFKNSTDLTGVTLPSTVTEIKDDAFYGCANLSEISIPTEVTLIGAQAFYNCQQLNEIVLPSGLLVLNNSVFEGCLSLSSITIPNTVTKIGDMAFYGCSSLDEINMSENIQSIGSEAFVGTAWDNKLSDGDLMYLGSVLLGYKGSIKPTGGLQIKSGTKIIASSAFENCDGITALRLPSSLRTIGDAAFMGCSGLSSLQITEGITTIKDNAFRNCTGITNISIPITLNYIGNDAFADCNNSRIVNINDVGAWCRIEFGNLQSIPMSNGLYLNNEQIIELTIPEGITEIHNFAFAHSNIIKAWLPEGVTRIGDMAFAYNNEMNEINIPASLLSIGDEAFGGVSYGYTTNINARLADIGAWCSIRHVGHEWERLRYCTPEGESIRDLVIPSYIRKIEEHSFHNQHFDSVDLGNCEILEEGAFCGAQIGSLILPPTIRSLGFSSLDNYNWNDKLYIEDWKAWSEIEFVNGGYNNPMNCSSEIYYQGKRLGIDIVDLVLPEGIKNISWDAFSRGFEKIKSLILPRSVESISRLSFPNITELIIPDNVKAIGSRCFEECQQLESLTLGASVESIGEAALPKSLKKLNITNLAKWSSANIHYTNMVDIRTAHKYINGIEVKDLVIPEGVKIVNKDVFRTWETIESVTFPASIREVNENAFLGCSNLKTIGFMANDSTINKSVHGSLFSIGSDDPNITEKHLISDVWSYWTIKESIPNIDHGNGADFNSTTLHIFEDTKDIYETYDIWGTWNTFGDTKYIKEAKSIEITPNNLSLEVGKTATLTAHVLPEDVYPIVRWTSDNPDIAYVESGTVLAKRSGTTKIYARSVDGSHVYSVCNVEVHGVPVEQLQISKTELNMQVGTKVQLNVTLFPDNATICDVIWRSNNEHVVTVENGEVFSHMPGCATIVVEATDGSYSSASCAVTVLGDYDLIAETKDGTSIANMINDGDDIEINDSYKQLSITKEIDASKITYSRVYKNDKWQPWFMPFDLLLTDDIIRDFSFAKFAGTYTNNGEFYITIVTLNKDDIVKGNTPYFIKAKKADSENAQLISQNDIRLLKTEQAGLRMFSAEKKIDVSGIYSRKVATDSDHDWYAYSGGSYMKINSGQALGAFRFYLTISDREDNPYKTQVPFSEVKILEIDNEANAIDSAQINSNMGAFYNLNGQRIQSPTKGLFIMNGKKFFIK